MLLPVFLRKNPDFTYSNVCWVVNTNFVDNFRLRCNIVIHNVQRMDVMLSTMVFVSQIVHIK